MPNFVGLGGTMDIEFLVERLERYILEESPKFLGSRTVNDDEVRNQLQQLRAAIPEEIRNAREIVAQKDIILEDARQEAERIISAGRAEAEQLAAEHRLVQEARHQSRVIVRRAEREAVGLRADADEYVFDSLSQLQGELTRLLHVVENGLQKLEAERERNLQTQDDSLL
jgi:vacuolar-type H+-ATPase subunit H